MSIDLDDCIRALDPAPSTELSATQQSRANARLDQIVNAPVVAPRFARQGRRWVIGAAAATAAAGLVVLPLATTADTANAYESWTASPGTLSNHDRSVANGACRDASSRIRNSTLALSERRGDWVVALYTGDEYVDSACMLKLPAGSGLSSDVSASSAGGQPAAVTGSQFTDGNVFQFGASGFLGIGARPTVSLTSGYVGPAVTGLDITGGGAETVSATIQHGRYLAWWPGPANTTHDAPGGSFSYTLHVDGAAAEDNAQPTLPK